MSNLLYVGEAPPCPQETEAQGEAMKRMGGLLMIAIGVMLAYANRQSTEGLIRQRRLASWARVPVRVMYVVFGVFGVLVGFGLLIGWLPR